MKQRAYNRNKRKFLKTCMYCSAGISLGLSNAGVAAREAARVLVPPNSGKPQFDFDKHKTEAHYYVQTPKGIKCKLCPNLCKIENKEKGDCRTRINNDGILECVAYGNPCAVHIDPVEKKPLYHFQPGSKTFSIATAGCNLTCLNCQNWEISQADPQETRNYDLMPEEVVNQAIKAGCKSIAYTYSDPVAFYEYVLDTSVIARDKGIRNILVSAGYINEEPLRQWCKTIDGANIDLKSFENEIYEMLNAGTLEPVLDTLRILKEENVWVEITNLIVPNWTDDMAMIKKMCDWLAENGFSEYPLHFSRFFPSYKLTDLPPTPIRTLEKAKEIAISSGLKYVYIGNAPETGPAVTRCPSCKTDLINRRGYTILQNDLQNGHCPHCKATVDGVWN